MSLEFLTENPVSAQEPSSNPFDLLPLRQFLVLLAKAHRRPMNALAKVLRISRDTLYHDLHAAEATLRKSVGAATGPEARCAECGQEPRMPGRTIGPACRNRWFRGYQNRRRAEIPRSDRGRRAAAYRCPDHRRDCPSSCAYLTRWTARFDAEHRPVD